MLKTAVRSGPVPPDDAWTGSSGQKRVHAPIREYRFIPHVERDPLLFPEPIISARVCALTGIRQSTMQRVLDGWCYV